MSAFLYGIILQWKLDLRNKGVLLTYYLVPLLFFVFVGSIFISINPEAKDTIIQTMTIFGVSMAAFLGAPVTLVELYGSEIKKAYKVGGVPLYVPALNDFISAFVHIMISGTIIFLLAPLIFDASLPQNILVYFLKLAFFIIVCLLVGTVLGLSVKNASKLTMASQLIFLPSLLLSGIMFPTELLPKVLEGIGKIFPATWGMKLLTSSNSFAFLPLGIILVVMVGVIYFKLSKIASNR